MRHTGSVRSNSKLNTSSTRGMNRRPKRGRYLVCVRNRGYEASLELRKLYHVLPDPKAARHGLVRVIDESGEDYLYSEDFFISVVLPKAVDKALSAAS